MDESHPPLLRFEMDLHGPAHLIALQFGEICDALAAKVEERATRRATPPPIPARPEGNAFARLSDTIGRFGTEIKALAPALQASSSPTGTPQMLVDNYARLLDCILTARDEARATEGPEHFQTPIAFQASVEALYDQVAQWPVQIRTSVERNTGDDLRIAVNAWQDFDPVDDASAADQQRIASMTRTLRQNVARREASGCATLLAIALVPVACVGVGHLLLSMVLAQR